MRRVPSLHGWHWITRALTLFRGSAPNWIMLNLALLMIALGLLVVPVIGGYVLNLLTPIFLAGMMSACRDQEAGRGIEIVHMFRGFRENASQLVTVGGVYLVGQVVITGMVMSIGGAELQEAMRIAAEGTGEQLSPAAADRISLAVLVGSALFVPLLMAVWFAPPLVILDNVPAVRAMQLSVRACLLNLLPFLLYGVIMVGLLVVAMAPLLAGLVLWVPLAVISNYTSYRDVFPAPATGLQPTA
jgi:uncharacterized membrane protein